MTVNSKDDSKRLPFVLAITGGSGAIYGLRLLQFLLEIEQPVELMISQGAIQVMREENNLLLEGADHKEKILEYLKLSRSSSVVIHNLNDFAATVSSGSYKTRGMAIVPCSGGTLGAIASGLSENLIHRAAAVCLKERRKLMLVVREMPFGHIQLKNMLTVSEAGGIIAAASPGFYHNPKTISDQVDFVVGRVLDQFDFDNNLFKHWRSEKVQPPVSNPTGTK